MQNVLSQNFPRNNFPRERGYFSPRVDPFGFPEEGFLDPRVKACCGQLLIRSNLFNHWASCVCVPECTTRMRSSSSFYNKSRSAGLFLQIPAVWTFVGARRERGAAAGTSLALITAALSRFHRLRLTGNRLSRRLNVHTDFMFQSAFLLWLCSCRKLDFMIDNLRAPLWLSATFAFCFWGVSTCFPLVNALKKKVNESVS